MNGLRFEVGEMAKLAISLRPEGNKYLGTLVEIRGFVTIGVRIFCDWKNVWIIPAAGDYLVQLCDGNAMLVKDICLRKLDAPDEPDSIVRKDECEA